MTIVDINEGNIYSAHALYRHSVGADGKYAADGSENWNNYTATWFQQTALPVDDPSSYLDGRYVAAGSAVPSPGQFITGTLVNKAQSKLVSQIKSVDFNAGIAFAEAEKSVLLVTNTAKVIAGMIWRLRHGDFEDAVRLFRSYHKLYSDFDPFHVQHPKDTVLEVSDISSAWLSLQYGWKPLLSDIYDGFRAFADATEQPRVRSGRVSASRTTSVDVSQSPSYYACRGPCKATVRYQYRMVEELPLARSLGLLDPLSILWERVPFSFIVDWFLPIGSYLENFNTIPFLKGEFLRTYKVQHHYTYSSINYPNWGKWVKGTAVVGRSTWIDRRVEHPETEAPTFKSLPEALSPLHIANAAALIQSAITRRPRVRAI